MMGAVAKTAEEWFQALREWRTRTIRLPRPRPWAPRSIAPIRRTAACPLCRSPMAEEYEARLEQAMLEGGGVRRVIREIAQELRTTIRWVERHWAEHMTHEPPTPLVGEWVYGGVEYVRTPVGWLPSGRVLRAIRESPHADLLLAVAQGKVRRRTLLDRGHYRDQEARRIGEAVLELASRLGALASVRS